jgi:hypothetical protein
MRTTASLMEWAAETNWSAELEFGIWLSDCLVIYDGQEMPK